MSDRRSAGRLFLAAPLTTEVRAALASHLRGAVGPQGLPGRRVAEDNWHLTLRFLGDSTVGARDALIGELSKVDLGGPFVLGFGRLGAFPRPDRARVLWIGATDGVDELRRIAEIAERAARTVGFEPDARRFSAHLTLSRLRPEQDVRQIIEQVPAFDGRATINHAVLYRSHLGPSGSRYESVHRFLLKAGTEGQQRSEERK